MFNEGRRDENGGTRWKLNEDLGLPENEMTAILRVEVPKRSDPTPPVREVVVIFVTKRPDIWSQVERCCCKDRIREYRDERLVPRSQLSHPLAVEFV